MESNAQKYRDHSWWLSWYPEPPANTRDRILFAAFCEVHLNGFQAASIQNIINGAGVTKGALYHYFSSKNEIGKALLDEVFSRYIEITFIQPLSETDDPVSTLRDHLLHSAAQISEQDVALGCPMDHFSQEMAQLDADFQQRINSLYQRKQGALVAALKRGQLAGNVSTDISAESIALFIQATMQGCMAMAKNAQSLATLMQCGEGLLHYLERLRPGSGS